MVSRCWLCGGALGSGERGVCASCVASLAGLCGRCSARGVCEALYRRALEERTRAGREAPPYPPCTARPVEVDEHPRLRRTQLEVYGLPVVGVVVLILAQGDLVVEEDTRRQVEMSERVQELVRAWGARWRDAA